MVPQPNHLRDELEEALLHKRTHEVFDPKTFKTAPAKQPSETRHDPREDVKVDVELKSLVSRIRNRATNIRDRVKKQKEQLFSEHDETQSNAPQEEMLPLILMEINDKIVAETTLSETVSSKRPKSGSTTMGNRTLLKPIRQEEISIVIDDTQSVAASKPELPLDMILSSLQAKHKAEKDALLVEI